MARFKCNSAADDLASELSQLAQDVQEDLGNKLLEAGAEVVQEKWKKHIIRHGHVKTGDMLKSVRKKRRGTKTIWDVYPQGKDRHGVRNAEKAYVLHYGTTKILGSHFVDDAEQEADAEASLKMTEVFEAYLKEKGLL